MTDRELIVWAIIVMMLTLGIGISQGDPEPGEEDDL